MEIVDLPLDQIGEAPWNPNRMDQAMGDRLKPSLGRYDLVQNLVGRPMGDGTREVVSGNQRLQVLKDMGMTAAPSVVVQLDDLRARLLAQALNRVQGEDGLGVEAELIREVLEVLLMEEVLNLLPGTAESLAALSSLGQENMADCLQNWQRAQQARLNHLQFQLTAAQLEVVQEALAQYLPQAKQSQGENPNGRGTALYLLCKNYLEGARV